MSKIILWFNQEKYPINNVKNTEIFQNVLEDFLSKNPDIKNKLGKKQKFYVNGNIVDVNKNLYDNEIRKDAKIIIQGWLYKKTKFILINLNIFALF